MYWLFNYSEFNPRNSCGEGWTMYLQVTHQLSDVIIFLCYITIPLLIYTLISEVNKRTEFKYKKLAFWYLMFIIFCGLSHFVNFLMFKYPMYRLDALIKCLIAIISVMACYRLMLDMPDLIEGMSPKSNTPNIVPIEEINTKKTKIFEEVDLLVKKVANGE